MQRVSEIRQRRERVFYKKRMEGNKEREKLRDRKLVEENAHLLPKMRASERERLEEEGVEAEELEGVREKAKVFGKMKERRVKMFVDHDEDGGDDEMDVD